MASTPIISWQIDGETVETVTDFAFLGSKIIADADYSHKIKRCLYLGRKDMINIESIVKSRALLYWQRSVYSKFWFFPVVMYRCESWSIKNPEHWRIDAVELWCWRRCLRALWTARSSSQSTVKEISPEYSLEGLMLKLNLQYFGHLMWRTDSLENTLMLGKIQLEEKGMTGDEMVACHHWVDRHEFEQALEVGDG